MTKDYLVLAQIGYDLRDAIEELQKIIELSHPNTEFDEDEFNVRMAHLYSHLNTAWNVRNLVEKDLETADGNQLNLWKEFPKDITPM